MKSQREENADEWDGEGDGRGTNRHKQSNGKGAKEQGKEEEERQAGAKALSTPKRHPKTKKTYRKEDDVDSVEGGIAQAHGVMMERVMSFTHQPAITVASMQMMMGSRAEGYELSVQSDSVPSSPGHARETLSCHHPSALADPHTPGREESGPC